MEIGKKIKLLRTENGYTQKALADKIGLTPKMISFYENGERIPPIDIVLKFVKIFNVQSDYLLGLTDERLPNESKEYFYTHKENRLNRLLTRYCKREKLSIRDIANQLNISEDLLKQIEVGIYNPSLELLQKISSLTGYEIDYLTGAQNSTTVPLEPIQVGNQSFDTSLFVSDNFFHTRFEELCLKNNININNSHNLGLSSQVFTDIKFNRMPTLAELLRISYGFDVTMDYLIGKSDTPFCNLSDDELELILNYRDCLEPYKTNIKERAEKLCIESIHSSSNSSFVAADEILKKTGTENMGK